MDSKNNRMWNWVESKDERRAISLLRKLLRLTDAEINQIANAIDGPEAKFVEFCPVDEATFKEVLG